MDCLLSILNLQSTFTNTLHILYYHQKLKTSCCVQAGRVEKLILCSRWTARVRTQSHTGAHVYTVHVGMCQRVRAEFNDTDNDDKDSADALHSGIS